jgi:hypothetical protein
MIEEMEVTASFRRSRCAGSTGWPFINFHLPTTLRNTLLPGHVELSHLETVDCNDSPAFFLL